MTTPQRLQDDWSQSFVTLTDELWDSLLRFATGLARHRSDAEDVVQTALIKAIRNFPRFCQNKLGIATASEATTRIASDEKLKAHLRNWLFKIVRHTSYDFHTTNVEFVEVDDDAIDYSTLAQTFQTPDDVLAFEKQFYKLALDDDWHKKLDGLTPKQRTVLFLAAEGHAYREIAELLEIPIGTVMSNLARALDKLKKDPS